MKIFKLALLLLSINSSLYAQVNNGEVYYKFTVVDNIIDSATIKKKDNGAMLEFVNNSIKSNSDKINFKLKFNKNESFYKMEDELIDESDKGYKIALALSQSKWNYYINITNDEKLEQKNAFGQNFIVKYNLSDIKWKLLKDSKKIDGYNCYKATYLKITKNSKGTFEKPVIAWYAPEIPVKFGPKGYGNLPGLIMELQEGNLKYYASKLILNPKKKITVKIPTKGKLVTKKEFDKISEGSGNWDEK